MTDRVEVSRKIPAVAAVIGAAFPDYHGRKVVVVAAEWHRVWDFWDGGSREYTKVVRLSDLKVVDSSSLPESMRQSRDEGNPLSLAITDRPLYLPPGFAVVVHSIYCGRDAGVTIKVNPDCSTKFLPAPVLALQGPRAAEGRCASISGARACSLEAGHAGNHNAVDSATEPVRGGGAA